MPQCDSSETCMRAVWPEPSPADLLPDWAAGVSEVSRFSCMKFLGVQWGLRPRQTEQKLALSLLSMLPSAHIYRVGVRVVCFRGSMATPPILYLRFAGSLAVSAQDSRPSGSLLLSRKALSSSTSCRFIPAHKYSHLLCLKQCPTGRAKHSGLTPWDKQLAMGLGCIKSLEAANCSRHRQIAANRKGPH
jgi:hypothetical protein